VVVELYARTEHANGLYYLMFGLHGLTALVPWFWSSVALMLVSFVLFLMPSFRNDMSRLPIACAHGLCRYLDREGHGPGGARLHPVADRRSAPSTTRPSWSG